MLFGSFQRERFYRQSERRWRELARTAAAAVVFADFPIDRGRRRSPVELPLAGDAPLLREWAVVCDAVRCRRRAWPGSSGPVGGRGEPRQFEAVWSVSPAVVRDDAANIATALARGRDPQVEPPVTAQPSSDLAATLRRATAVTNRIVAYLDA